ncbi:MAG: ATP-binding protein [Bacteroidota bacterium]
MMKLTVLTVSLIVSFAFQATAQPEKTWETEGLITPESVLYDGENDVFYISNINGKPTDKDDNGFISKLGTEGNILKKKWVKGLHAPKGMVKAHGHLYVTDIDRIAKIDLDKGEIVKYYDVETASFLNDMEVIDGTVYISDMAENVIYSLNNNKVQVFKNEGLKKPNGMLTSGKWLINGNENYILKIHTKTHETQKIETAVGGIDGLKFYDSNTYITSDWTGNVHKVNASGEAELLFSTADDDIQAADFEYVPSKKLLVVPTFFNNTVAAYQLQ